MGDVELLCTPPSFVCLLGLLGFLVIYRTYKSINDYELIVEEESCRTQIERRQRKVS
jgi:xanthosine utilization system XapX-like protein